jgi:hypothetical protein
MNRLSTIGYRSDTVDGVLSPGAAKARDRNRR